MKSKTKKLWLLVIAMCVALCANAHDAEIDGIYYNFSGTEASVTYQGNSYSEYSDEYTGTIFIPETVTYNNTTYSVTCIGNYAFYGCSGLTSVTIPNSVTSIGDYALYFCYGLTFVTIPERVTSIGDFAFGYCSGLTSITIPNSVTEISIRAFAGCRSLTSVTIPNSVARICDQSFSDCISLTSVTIPNSVAAIGNFAFDGCSGLTSISIPSNVTIIGRGAFRYCSNLEQIVVESDNMTYDSREGCNAIIETTSNTLIAGCKNTNIPESVTSIDLAFCGCSGLTSVTIPNSVTSIGDAAFCDCSGLTSVTIPNSVASIGDGAFAGCTGLTSISIPSNVTIIGRGAFSYCSSLEQIVVESGNTVYDSRESCNAIIETSSNTLIAGCKNTNIPESVTSICGYAYNGCSGLTSVNIPNSVTSIGYNAFGNCSGLISIIIPNGVTSIGNYAFLNCCGLTDVYCYATEIPTVGNNVFGGVTTSSTTLHVPAAALEAYRTTEPWSEFGTIVAIEDEQPEPAETLTVVNVGRSVSSFDPNIWYFVHQARESSSQSAGSYSYCPLGEVPTTGGFITDMGEDLQVKKMSVDNVAENSTFDAAAPYLIRFVPVEGHAGAYHIQFGTENWLCAPASQGNGWAMATSANSAAAGTFNVYAIPDANNPGYFALNVSDSRGDYQELIDNDGNNALIVTWSSGLKTTATGNSTWSIVEAVFTEMDAREALYNELTLLAGQYEAMLPTLQANLGNTPGCYDTTKVTALSDLIQQVYDLDYTSTTIAGLEALKESLTSAYEAALHKIPITLANGYYRIKGAMTFTSDKYLQSTQYGDVFYATWATPELKSDATALWRITNTNGYFDIVNVATSARFNDVVKSNPVSMSSTSENLMAVDPVSTDENGVAYCNIRVSTQAANSDFYLHMGGHGNGVGVSNFIVGWYSTIDGDTYGASEWVFQPVTDEAAQAVIDAYAAIIERATFLARYDSLMAEVQASLEEVRGVQYTAVIQNANQLSSPYTESSEGSLAALIDDNTSTYWHSKWSGGSVAGGIHYLQVDIVETADMDLYATFTRRPTMNDHVTNMSVFGTNEPDADKEGCEELLVWNTPYGSNTETLTSAVFSNSGYRYLRFYANTTTSSRGYWHISELQVYKKTVASDALIHYMQDEADNLHAVIGRQTALARNDIGMDEYNELKEAYDKFMVKYRILTGAMYALQDGDVYDATTDTGHERMAYTRTFSNTDWQALYVPFEMTYADWQADFEVARLNDVHQWDDNDDGTIDRTELEAIKMKSGKTEANTPYLIRAKSTGEKTITLTNATLYKAEENSFDVSSWNTKFTFTGTYSGISGTDMFTNGYYVMGGGTLHQAESSAYDLSPFRWYMTVTDRNGNPKSLGEVKVMLFDTTDGINLTPALSQGEGDAVVYDLSGRRTDSPTKKGVYIKNGRKVIVR
ncbi:MAG: leucine-rich repeat protein [Bacteroidaceae bacterium]|nr:leucine-rich repeat protein [Bacteroidaceae bacterium]